MHVCLNAIGTAVPAWSRHAEFLDSLEHWIHPPEAAAKTRRIALNSEIARRYTVLEHPLGPPGSGAFYTYGSFPATGRRMEVYRREAPALAAAAVERLGDGLGRPDEITHLIVTSCTGFSAPGVDVDLVRRFGLSPAVKRTVIGFMGCYAGVTALRTAQEIVRADPAHRVLIVSVELCSLHLQETREMDRLVSFCLFADGAAAAVVSSRPHGIALHEGFSWLSLGDAERMSWNIGDDGFAMTLDARVPARIRQMIREHPEAAGSCACAGPDDLWAVHPGGRMILDAVESAFGLSAAQMAPSRAVLREYGNMSSASILFVLAQLLGTQSPRRQRGHAIAFGPGLALEGIGFERLPAPAARSEGSGGTYPESQVSLEGVAAGPDYLARCPAP